MSSFRLDSGRQILGLAALLLAGTAAQAASDPHFELSVYLDAPGGQELVSGDYAGATRALGAGANVAAADEAAVSTNRCVLLTMTQHLAAARAACDAAVAQIEADRLALKANELVTRQVLGESLAIAYSNRAVVKWLSTDATGAAQDLARARALSAAQVLIDRNVAALGTRSTVAEVATIPQS